MYICTLQFGPVMSPRLLVRVRLLPGQFKNWTVSVYPGGFENDRNLFPLFVGLGVIRHMKFVVGRSVCILKRRKIYMYAYIVRVPDRA